MSSPLDKIIDLEVQIAEMREGFYKIRATVRWNMQEGLWKDGREPLARGYIEGVCASHLFDDDTRSSPEAKDDYIMQLFISEATLRNVIGVACIRFQDNTEKSKEIAKNILLEVLQTVPSPQRLSSLAKPSPQNTSTTALRNLKDLLGQDEGGSRITLSLTQENETEVYFLSSGGKVVAQSPTLEDCISLAAAKE